MRLSLRTRFIVLITTILLVVFAVVSYFLIRNAGITQTNDLNRESKAFASLATTSIGDAYGTYKDSGTVRIDQAMGQFTDLDSNISNIGIAGLDGTIEFRQSGTPAFVVSSTDVRSFDPVYYSKAGLITQIVEPYFDQADGHPFSVVYTISSAELAHSIQAQEIDVVVFAAIGLLMTAVATYALIRRFFLEPIERVSGLALIVSQGNYDQQISVGSNDEIGDLAHSVNQMANTLKGNIQKLREVDQLKNEFIMIASHNLRTPLSVIVGNVDLLKGSSSLEADAHNMITAIESSVRSLGVFAEDMLTIASIENGEAVLSLKKTSVSQLLRGLEQEFSNLAQTKGVALEWHVDNQERELNMSEVHLRGAVRNLLDNAVKFTKAGGTVTFSLGYVDSETQISVKDTGAGIAPEELPKLFTKFHRGTSTLVYDYTGTGIGLYAAKLIVAAHHGTITVDSHAGQGSTFTIHLPDQLK